MKIVYYALKIVMIILLVNFTYKLHKYSQLERIKLNFFFWISVEMYSLFFIGLIVLLSKPSNNYIFSSMILIIGVLIWYYVFTRVYQDGEGYIFFKTKIIESKKVREKTIYFHKVSLIYKNSNLVLYNPFVSMDKFEKVKIRK